MAEQAWFGASEIKLRNLAPNLGAASTPTLGAWSSGRLRRRETLGRPGTPRCRLPGVIAGDVRLFGLQDSRHSITSEASNTHTGCSVGTYAGCAYAGCAGAGRANRDSVRPRRYDDVRRTSCWAEAFSLPLTNGLVGDDGESPVLDDDQEPFIAHDAFSARVPTLRPVASLPRNRALAARFARHRRGTRLGMGMVTGAVSDWRRPAG
jgi:hypothetical protein